MAWVRFVDFVYPDRLAGGACREARQVPRICRRRGGRNRYRRASSPPRRGEPAPTQAITDTGDGDVTAVAHAAMATHLRARTTTISGPGRGAPGMPPRSRVSANADAPRPESASRSAFSPLSSRSMFVHAQHLSVPVPDLRSATSPATSPLPRFSRERTVPDRHLQNSGGVGVAHFLQITQDHGLPVPAGQAQHRLTNRLDRLRTREIQRGRRRPSPDRAP